MLLAWPPGRLVVSTVETHEEVIAGLEVLAIVIVAYDTAILLTSAIGLRHSHHPESPKLAL